MKKFYAVAFVLVLGACERTDEREEVQFEGATFGFVSKSKTTIETTLHSRQIYVESTDGADKKVLVDYGTQQMDIFPPNEKILSGVVYTIVDTVRRGDMQPPTVATNTLYIDPAVFSKAEYELIVRFVQSNFKDPITSNRLVRWLDDDVLGLNPDAIYYTVYAVVYEKMATFEKRYKASEGTDRFTIRVDNYMRVARMHDDTEGESFYEYSFRNDTLFYPSYDGIDEAKRMLTYRDKEGRPFSEIAKVLVEVQPK
jgi:hypothetical protein